MRATLLTDINQLRLQSETNTIGARQQLAAIARDFGRPDAARLDAFLYGGPQAIEGVVVSGTVAFCKEQGLPLANWRDVIDSPATATPPSPAARP